MGKRGFNPISGLLSFILLLFIIAAGLIYGVRNFVLITTELMRRTESRTLMNTA